MSAYSEENLGKRRTLKKRKNKQNDTTRKQHDKRDMDSAFERLRHILPPKNHRNEDLTEVEVLRQTLKYIIHLNNILREE